MNIDSIQNGVVLDLSLIHIFRNGIPVHGREVLIPWQAGRLI